MRAMMIADAISPAAHMGTTLRRKQRE